MSGIPLYFLLNLLIVIHLHLYLCVGNPIHSHTVDPNKKLIFVEDLDDETVDLYNRAATCQENEDLACAISIYQNLLKKKFDFGLVHQNLAFCYQAVGKWTEAAYHHKQAAIWFPEKSSRATSLSNYVYAYLYSNPFYHGSSAVLENIIKILKLALQLDPANRDVLLRLGHYFTELGKLEVSLQYFLQLTKYHPTYSLGYLNIGNYFFRIFDFKSSVTWYTKTVEIMLLNIESSSTNISRQDKMKQYNHLAMAYSNLGSAHRILDHNLEALVAYLEAFRYSYFAFDFRTMLAPLFDSSRHIPLNHSIPYAKFTPVLFNSSYPQRIPSMDDLLNTNFQPRLISGEDSWAVSNLMATMTLLCNWNHLELIEALLIYSVNSIESGRYIRPQDASSDPAVIDSYSFMLVRYSSLTSSKYLARDACKSFLPIPKYLEYDQQRGFESTPRVLRIGYFSYDWRDHPMGRLTGRFVTHHNLSRIFSVSYSYGYDDSSEMRKRVVARSPLFVEMNRTVIPVTSDAAELIVSHQIDILVDLTALTFNSRFEIPASKPAPLIINYLGYPGTTGCRAYDYTIVDPVSVPPESSRSFEEKFIYLSNSRAYQGNDMPLHIPLSCSQQSCGSNTLRNDLKVTESSHWVNDDTVILCTFNANKKLEPLSFRVWMSILTQIPNSILVMLSLGRDPQYYIHREAAVHGILPKRIAFLPKVNWEIHLERASGCDLVLDTFTYGAHTTSSDMLWQAVPIVTLAAAGSGKMPSRVASSLLSSLKSAASLSITYTIQEYEDVILKLCRSKYLRSSLKLSIAKNSLIASTFNKVTMQTSLEESYQQAWEIKNIFQRKSKFHDPNTHHRLTLPHIIGSHEGQSGKYEMLERGLELIKMLACHGRSIEVVSFLNSSGSTYIENLKERIGDSDAPAANNISKSLQSIRNRLYLADIEKKFPMMRIQSQEWHELLYSPCVYSFNCSTICQVPKSGSISISSPRSLVDEVRQKRGSFSHVGSEFLTYLADQNFTTSRYFSTSNLGTSLSRFLSEAEMSSNVSQLLEIVSNFHSQFLGTNNSLVLCHLFNFFSPYFFIKQPLNVFLTNFSSEQLQNYRLTSFEIRKALIDQYVWALNHETFRPLIYVIKPDLLSTNDFDRSLEILQDYVYNPECLVKSRIEEILLSMIPLLIYSGNPLLAYPVGFKILEFGYPDIGLRLSTYGVLLKHIINNPYPPAPQQLFKTDKIRIVIYCDEYDQSYWPSWNRSSLGQGLGGSEEAVIYFAEALALNSNVQVEVYLDVFEYHNISVNENQGVVHYLPYLQYPLDDPPEIFISWRYSISLGLAQNSNTKKILWLHDLLPPKLVPKELMQYCDMILVPSQFHKSYFQSNFPPSFPINILPHGLNQDLLMNASQHLSLPRNHAVFVYASSPLRGLTTILTAWPQIKSLIPDARLDIFYGFSPPVVSSLKNIHGSNYSLYEAKIKMLLSQEGINYIGMVSNSELMKAFATSSFLVYPTKYPETGCLTCLKAMAMGCLPITSKFIHSNLPYLIGEYDLGPEVPLTSEMDELQWMSDHWIPSLKWAYDQSISRENGTMIEILRKKMMEETLQKYNWEKNSEIFLSMVRKLEEGSVDDK